MLGQAIVNRNPTEMFKQADEYNNRDSEGNYYSNQTDVSIVVTCLDSVKKHIKISDNDLIVNCLIYL